VGRSAGNAALGALATILLASPVLAAQSAADAAPADAAAAAASERAPGESAVNSGSAVRASEAIDTGLDDGSVFDEPVQPLRKLGLMLTSARWMAA